MKVHWRSPSKFHDDPDILKAPNHPVLRWLKTVVVSDREKARLIASGGDQEDVPETPGPEVLGVGVRC